MIYILVTILFSFKCIANDLPENKEKELIKRDPQPITIINISASSLELNQMLATLQKLQTPPSAFQSSKENLQTIGNSVSNFIDKYKYWTPAATVSFLYCCLVYKIMNTNKLLNTQEAWCNWKAEIEFNKLLAISQKDLSNDLISDIQKKYIDSQNPTNFVTPMVNFVNDINQEIKNLEEYIKIGKIIKKLKTSSLFPINDEKINLANEKINKLTYLKNVFSEWSIDFKQQQLNKKNN